MIGKWKIRRRRPTDRPTGTKGPARARLRIRFFAEGQANPQFFPGQRGNFGKNSILFHQPIWLSNGCATVGAGHRWRVELEINAG